MAIKKEKKTTTKRVVKRPEAEKKEEKVRADRVKPVKAAKKTTPRKARVKVKERIGERIPVAAVHEVPPQPAYITPQPVPVSRIEEPIELPHEYGETKISLLVRDPYWVYTYWEIQNSVIDGLRADLKDRFNSAKKVLRVYDVTDIIFNGKNAHSFFDIELTGEAANWYIRASSGSMPRRRLRSL